MGERSKSLPLDWGNIGLMALVHVAAIGGMALYLPLMGLSLGAALTGLVLTGLTIFSISAGYHRLFSHRAYEARPLVRLFLLIFGAGAFQNSVLTWSADHRRHHSRTDTELDPYNAQRGFWHSHIGWVFHKPDADIPVSSVHDLERDPLVLWQHRHFGKIGILAGLVLPALIGLAFGDIVGGFVVGAALRLLVCYHATFAINSFAHRFGTRPYSDKTSARDSLFVALLSMGEGYHNFHHAFPADYRNGAGRHQYDPTKWVLWLLERLGSVHHLKRTPVASIVRAQGRMQEQHLETLNVPATTRCRLQVLREAKQLAATQLTEIIDRRKEARATAGPEARQRARQLGADLKGARRQFSDAARAWRRMLDSIELSPAQ